MRTYTFINSETLVTINAEDIDDAIERYFKRFTTNTITHIFESEERDEFRRRSTEVS